MTMATTAIAIDSTQQTSMHEFVGPITFGSGRPLMHMWGTGRINQGTPVKDTNLLLAVDLGISLEFTASGVIATALWIDDYAFGQNQPEAEANLLSSLLEFRDSLEHRSTQAELSDELMRTKEMLQSLFRGN